MTQSQVVFHIPSTEIRSLDQVFLGLHSEIDTKSYHHYTATSFYQNDTELEPIDVYWKVDETPLESEKFIALSEWKAPKEKTNKVIQAISWAPFGRWRLFDPKNKTHYFYGGSFNPWHEGHAQCLKAAAQKGPITVVIDNNPQKNLEQADSWNRFQNLDKIVPASSFLFAGFLIEERKNPTSKWIKQLKIQFPQTKIGLVMGEDSFLSLHKWIEAHELLIHLDRLHIVPRNQSREDINKQKKGILKINPELTLEFSDRHQFEQLSSTSLRNNE